MAYATEYLKLLIKEKLDDIQKEKDKIVSELLIKNGFDEIEKEFSSGVKKMFPNLVVQVQKFEQVYIANNGTLTGKIIVLFRDHVSFEGEVCKIQTDVISEYHNGKLIIPTKK